jgi:tetratricopeptide (TPR) repeat protein
VLAAFAWGILHGAVLLAGLALPMLEEAVQVGIGAGLGALALWFLLFLPHLYVLPLFLKRECAWTDALEASAILLSLDPWRSVALGLAVTMRFLTVWRIPSALLLLDLALEGRNELVAAVMHEKPLREAHESLSTAQATRAGALVKPYELLEAGRYLDALNQFQIYRRRNREDPDALRGECLALLALGNARGAREKLEWWERLDPDNEEPSRILNEVAQGRWDEGGDLWAEAQARATQRITTRGY